MGDRLSSLSDILYALADVVRAIPANNPDWDIQVEPWFVINPSPITVDMWPASPPLDDTLAGFVDIEGARLFTVRARTNTPDSDATRDVLLSLMDVEDPHSIKVALESNQTLFGLATSVVVTSETGLEREPTLDGGWLLAVSWTVLVIGVPVDDVVVPPEEPSFLLQGDGVSKFVLGDGTGFLIQGGG